MFRNLKAVLRNQVVPFRTVIPIISVLLTAGLFIFGIGAVGIQAQTRCSPSDPTPTCSNLQPGENGKPDSVNIDCCLQRVNSVTLGSGTFTLGAPVLFYGSNAVFAGQGRASTTIALSPTYTCTSGSENFVIDVNGQVGARDNIKIRRFFLDLAAWPSACSNAESAAVRLLRTNNIGANKTEVSGLTLQNQSGTLKGIKVVKSKNVIIQSNKIREFTTGGGIETNDSPAATIYSNDIINPDIGIIVRNNAGASAGGEFDSSNTDVSLNLVDGARGRAMKLEVLGQGVLPLRNMVVFDNDLLNFQNLGLYLNGGVRQSRIENNTVSGTSTSNFALLIGSVFVGHDPNAINPVFDNQINNNQFTAGVFDVTFSGLPETDNLAGPDQITISRLTPGNNFLGGHGLDQRHPNTGVCGQFAHAWWSYQPGFSFVSQGGKIRLAAAGTRKDSLVTYKIVPPGGDPNSPAQSFTTSVFTNSVCVINEHDSVPITVSPGAYDLYVDLTDGNARYPNSDTGAGIVIKNWKLPGGQLVVQP